MLRKYNRHIYIALLSVLTLCLLCDYIPALRFLVAWVTPPVVLFIGLVFALLCGQAYPTFNNNVGIILQRLIIFLLFDIGIEALVECRCSRYAEVYHLILIAQESLQLGRIGVLLAILHARAVGDTISHTGNLNLLRVATNAHRKA